jgi:hypothetical protein
MSCCGLGRQYSSWKLDPLAFLYPQFDNNTSNIVEPLNSVWNSLRSLPLLKIVDIIWSISMKTIYDRNHRLRQSTEIAEVPRRVTGATAFAAHSLQTAKLWRNPDRL